MSAKCVGKAFALLTRFARGSRITELVPPGDVWVYVWVYWQCDERDETGRVRDVSLSGLFIVTTEPRAVGLTAKVDLPSIEDKSHPTSSCGVYASVRPKHLSDQNLDHDYCFKLPFQGAASPQTVASGWKTE